MQQGQMPMAHRRRYAGLIAGGEKFLVEGAVVSRSDLRQRRVSHHQ
jgi:hypothetical protein